MCIHLNLMIFTKIIRGFIRVGLRKDDTELKAAFDKALTELRQDGTYDKMAKKYFDFNVYGD